MKYNVKRGSVGRPLVIKKLRRPEGTITIRAKKIRENRIANEIINSLNDGKGYNQIAKDLGLSKKEVLLINQRNTLRHGSNINKINIKDMINLGITTKDIGEIYNCKESYIISILKNLDYNNLEIKEEIEIAIKVRDMLYKGFNLNDISKELKIRRYKLFDIYNKYFEKYSDEVIDFETIEQLLQIKLNYNEISKFYNIPKQYLMELININEKSKKNRAKKNFKEKIDVKDEEHILTKSYKNSDIDFYAKKYIR